LSIGGDGTVSATIAGQSAPTELGTIQLADFINQSGLQPIGENLFKETASSGAATAATPGTDGLGRIISGALESSNVNIAEEMVNMIETQRAYEVNAKAISAVDQMLQYANNNI
jgi:flagellar basal-body rod protein FlgG